jgi:hypothetical protein
LTVNIIVIIAITCFYLVVWAINNFTAFIIVPRVKFYCVVTPIGYQSGYAGTVVITLFIITLFTIIVLLLPLIIRVNTLEVINILLLLPPKNKLLMVAITWTVLLLPLRLKLLH